MKEKKEFVFQYIKQNVDTVMLDYVDCSNVDQVIDRLKGHYELEDDTNFSVLRPSLNRAFTALKKESFFDDDIEVLVDLKLAEQHYLDVELEREKEFVFQYIKQNVDTVVLDYVDCPNVDLVIDRLKGDYDLEHDTDFSSVRPMLERAFRALKESTEPFQDEDIDILLKVEEEVSRELKSKLKVDKFIFEYDLRPIFNYLKYDLIKFDDLLISVKNVMILLIMMLNVSKYICIQN